MTSALQVYGQAQRVVTSTQTLVAEVNSLTSEGTAAVALIGQPGSLRHALFMAAQGPVHQLRREVIAPIRAQWEQHPFHVQGTLTRFPQLKQHPQWPVLLALVSSLTDISPAGFPRITAPAFQQFIDHVPHLFSQGNELIGWLDQLENILQHQQPFDEKVTQSVQRASKVLRTMIFTASITAPPDLWLLRQVLATFKDLDILESINAGKLIHPVSYAAQHGLDAKQLKIDLDFLYGRGYLDKTRYDCYIKTSGRAAEVLEKVDHLPSQYRRNMTEELLQWFQGKQSAERQNLLQSWFQQRRYDSGSHSGWIANMRDIEDGYRLTPLVLALKATQQLEGLQLGQIFRPTHWTPEMAELFDSTGLTHEGRLTALGHRMLSRGSGPFGIIETYHPYTNRHHALLQAEVEKPHVVRAANIAASREANRKTFRTAVQQLHKLDYRPRVVIEHALGLGVAIQEFVKVFGEEGIQFVGADYENTALDGARAVHQAGELPAKMDFYQADIADPQALIDQMREDGIDPRGAVMIVGNGFHEARKDDEDFVKVIRTYALAGIIPVFIEESALTPKQHRTSAWNTYNSAFNWVHEVSGQRLRAPWPYEPPHHRLSWQEALEQGGYSIIHELSVNTRPMLPYAAPPTQNPPISRITIAVPTAAQGGPSLTLITNSEDTPAA